MNYWRTQNNLWSIRNTKKQSPNVLFKAFKHDDSKNPV